MSTPLRLLLVEDSEDDALLLIHTLKKGGYEPSFERVDLPQAMQDALKKGKWDLVISDYNMPGFSAIAALNLLKETEIDIPFIIVSGAIGEETAVAAMKSGAQDYIMKDNLARLIPAIERELREAKNHREKKQAEEEKKRMEIHLLQAHKMEAIGRLTGGVSHDFNNYLTAISGYTDMAITQAEPGTQLYKDLKEIGVAAERAMNLTRQLLLFSRHQPMKFSSVDLNKTVEYLFGVLKRITGEDIQIRYDLDKEPIQIYADQTSIDQLIMNLVVNAREALLEGGRITIKTEIMEFNEAGSSNLNGGSSGRFACFSVTDTGQGMDHETQEHIFDPFRSAKEFGTGSGLGLSVVYGIVRQHKGWIQVHSKLGEGSIFQIFLPLIGDKSRDTAGAKGTAGKYQGKGERILLIEDETGVRHFAEKALTRNGYMVFTAANEKEATDLFEKENGNFELIFSDVVLPNADGIQLIDRLLSEKPGCRILLTSGFTDHGTEWKMIKKKGYFFLQKPYTLTKLLKTIQDVINRKSSLEI